jgi:hypothetical protein
MPCHSTPFYAYIHAPIAMDFIKCLPPITYDGYSLFPSPFSAPRISNCGACVCVCVCCACAVTRHMNRFCDGDL